MTSGISFQKVIEVLFIPDIYFPSFLYTKISPDLFQMVDLFLRAIVQVAYTSSFLYHKYIYNYYI